MLTEYLPIVVMGGLAAIFAVGSIVASSLLRPNNPNPVKSSAYECGNDPVRLPRGERFSVKFYVVAMLFIIFDIETIFLFPWAVSFRRLGVFGLAEMAVFVGLVFVAYAYIWRKGGFDWAQQDVTPSEPEEVVARERAQQQRRERARREAERERAPEEAAHAR
jgi:NADH-quinone oxidoreductase subunit A